MCPLGITEEVLVICSVVNNDYKQNSRLLYIFFSNKSFGQLIDISSKNFIFLRTFNYYILKYGLLIKLLSC